MARQKTTEFEKRIKEKYLKAPSVSEIREYIYDDLGINCAQFERFFDIPETTVKHVLQGRQNLPVKYWPLIYERKVPTYGRKYTKRKEKEKGREKEKKGIISGIIRKPLPILNRLSEL